MAQVASVGGSSSNMTEWKTVQTDVRKTQRKQKSIPDISNHAGKKVAVNFAKVSPKSKILKSLPAAARCGWEDECLLEALFLEVVSFIKEGSVLNYTGVTSHDDQVDLTHIRLACDTGDLETTFNVMKAWTEQLKKGREPAERWCQDNGVSSQTVRQIEAGVVQSYRKLISGAPTIAFPPLKYTSDMSRIRNCWKNIAKLSFKDGLCVYSGHKQIGYIHAKSGDCLPIPATSVFNFMNHDLPKFVISLCNNISKGLHYSTILSYEEGITILESVSDTTVTKFMEENVVKPLLYTADQALVRRFDPHLGDKCHTELVKQIQKICADSPFVFDIGLRDIYVYAPIMYHMIIQETLELYTKTLLEQATESRALNFPSLSSPLKLVMGPGSVCVRPLERLDYTVLRVIKLKTFSEDDVHQIAQEYNGQVIRPKLRPVYDYWGEVHFELPCDAGLAFKNQSCEAFFLEPVLSKQPLTAHETLTQSLASMDKSIDIQLVCKKANKYYKNVKSFWETLSSCFEKSDIFNIDISISEESSRDTFYASIICTDLKTAHNVYQKIELGFCGSHTTLVNEQYMSMQMLSFFVDIDNSLYSVLKDKMLYCAGRSNKLERDIKFTEYVGGYNRQKGKISSEDTRYTMLIMTHFSKMFQPALIWSIPDYILPYFTGIDASVLLDEIGNNTNTFIHISPELNSLYIYGSKKDASSVDKMIHILLSPSYSENQNVSGWFYIDIDWEGNLKIVQDLTHRLNEARTLCERWNIHAIKFLPRQSRVGFNARMDNYKRCKTLICSDFTDLGIICAETNITESQCCACFVPVKSDESYSLQQCGHVYCMECIKLQIKCALQTSTFPINCAECNTPVSCMDIKILCGRYQLDIEVQKLNSASLNIFIGAHKHYRHCPNYNCKGFIDTTIKYRCILCHSKICSDCLEVFHEPETCEEYIAHFKQVDHWINERPDDRKRCPNCGIGIERTTGCYNVSCIACKKKICWGCLAFFDYAKECYRHLTKTHGGYWGDRQGNYLNHPPR